MSLEFSYKWDFIGQKNVINKIKIMVKASKIKNQPLEHILLVGPSGMGKTTIAQNIAKELKCNLHVIQGSSINKISDVITILTNLKPFDIIFFDEIHVVNSDILEVLYTALEGKYINIIVGKDFNNKVIKIKLPDFTFIAATDKVGYLTKPLVSRINNLLQLEPYNIYDSQNLIRLTFQKYGWLLNDKTVVAISSYCQLVPRLIINLVKQLYNYCLVTNTNINETRIDRIMIFLDINLYGLNSLQVRYLKIIANNYFSLETIAMLLNEEIKNIEFFCEPLLLSLGLIIKSSKGRKLTVKGEKYLGKC